MSAVFTTTIVADDTDFGMDDVPVPPSKYLCPLTGTIMTDPVLSIHGTVFERRAILKWIDMGNSLCPMTGKPLSIKDLVSDKRLASVIAGWKDVNDYDEVMAEYDDTYKKTSQPDNDNESDKDLVEKLGLLGYTPMALHHMEDKALEALKAMKLGGGDKAKQAPTANKPRLTNLFRKSGNAIAV